MKVWITGASGLLGFALKDTLHRRGIAYAGSSHTQADVSNLASLSRFWEAEGPFTHIINCAAYTKVDWAEEDPEAARRSNALGPALLGLFAASKGVHVVHVSTDYVFDGTSKRPYRETDAAAPGCVYGKTKWEGEERLQAVLPTSCIIRTSWLFGRGGKNFAGHMLEAMKQKEEVRVVCDQRGKPTFAADLAEVLIQALHWKGLYHFANREETTWHAYAEAIFAEARAQGIPLLCRKITPVSTAEFTSLAKRPLYSVLDTTKIEQQLRRPIRSWREGLSDFIRESRQYAIA